jgi:prevent-host-death family protein
MDMAREIAAGKFKAECLALLDRVAATGEEIVVTKRGKPVARVLPVEEPPSLLGSIRILVSEEELLKPLDDWEVDRL